MMPVYRINQSKSAFHVNSLSYIDLISHRFVCSSSSAGVRAWSNLRVATRAISVVTLITGLAYIQLLYYAQRNLQLQRCDAQLGTYLTFYGVFNLIIFGVGPSTCMLIFGLLTIRHVHQIQRRVVPINTHILARDQSQLQPRPQYHQKKTDRQLLRMLLVQCIASSLTAAPTPVNYIYSSVVSTLPLDALQIAKNNLATTILNYLSSASSCLSFYLFILSSELFRRELTYLFRYPRQTVRGAIRNTTSLQRRN